MYLAGKQQHYTPSFLLKGFFSKAEGQKDFRDFDR